MALSTVIRRASSKVKNLACRSVRSPASVRGGAVFFSTERLILGSNQLRSCGSSVVSTSFTRRYCSEVNYKKIADQKLVSVIDDEIEDAEEADGTNFFDKKPEGFPFEIIDTPGERNYVLKRNFENEKIEVVVDSFASYNDDEEEDQENNDEDDDNQENNQEENSTKIRVSMIVNVTKSDGVSLKFGVSAYPNDIVIDSLSIKQPNGADKELAYEGPDFHHLDMNLKKAFYRFLEVRGIVPTFTNYLSDCIAQKDFVEYLQWLKVLKSFVEE